MVYLTNLCKLFAKYKLIDQSNTNTDLNLSLELIENILKNSDKYKNECMLANEQIEKLQYRLKHKHSVNEMEIMTTNLLKEKQEFVQKYFDQNRKNQTNTYCQNYSENGEFSPGSINNELIGEPMNGNYQNEMFVYKILTCSI